MPRRRPQRPTPGKKYPNRSDLREPPMAVVPGQTYGTQTQQVEAQRTMKAARNTGRMTPTGVFQAAERFAGGGGPDGRAPLEGLPALDAETEFPDEPLTAGSVSGEGPGPEILGLTPGPEDAIRALYLTEPNEDLRELVEEMEAGLG